MYGFRWNIAHCNQTKDPKTTSELTIESTNFHTIFILLQAIYCQNIQLCLQLKSNKGKYFLLWNETLSNLFFQTCQTNVSTQWLLPVVTEDAIYPINKIEYINKSKTKREETKQRGEKKSTRLLYPGTMNIPTWVQWEIVYVFNTIHPSPFYLIN